MAATKRLRAIYWTEEDKKILRRLILERAEIIENKDCRTNSNNAKMRAWVEVLTCNIEQTRPNKIKNRWRNMKNQTKKSEFAFRRARTMTGVGPPPASPPPEDRELIEAIPLEFTVDYNSYDSDSIQKPKTNQKTSTPQNNSEETSMLPITSHPVVRRQIKKDIKAHCCNKDDEHDLFILAKTAREEAMQREREVHEKRMALMSLEEEY